MSTTKQPDAKVGTTEEVRRMYEKYPYPSPTVGESYIRDLANAVAFIFPETDFAGQSILDGGCGTGHRLVGLAKQYPKANVTGVDMTQASLEVAAAMAVRHGATNMRVVRDNLLDLRIEEKFDLITTTGVLHHLEDPQTGLNNLCARLKDNGVILIWLYHSIGEFERLLQREAAWILGSQDKGDFTDRVEVMRELGLRLSSERYGTNTSRQSHSDVDRVSIDVDAFIHPIVRGYRFDEVIAILKAAGMDWTCVNGVNTEGASLLIDLGGCAEDPTFCLSEEKLLKTDNLIKRYRALSPLDKLRVIEITAKPTGFTILAGRGESYRACDPRIQGGVLI